MRGEAMRKGWVVLAFVTLGCGSDGAPSGPITGPVAGTISGKRFEARGARAEWSEDGQLLGVRLIAAEMPPCSQATPPIVDNWMEMGITFAKASVTPGKTGTYSFSYKGPSSTQVGGSAALYGGRDGTAQTVTLPSEGHVKLTSVTADRIDGEVDARDPKNGLSVRGVFSVPICAR